MGLGLWLHGFYALFVRPSLNIAAGKACPERYDPHRLSDIHGRRAFDECDLMHPHCGRKIIRGSPNLDPALKL